jgi:hypothetical protein
MDDPRQRRLVERIAETQYLEDLRQIPMEQLREMRDECREGENELSFERRLCQARIDILSGELDRRSGRGGDKNLVDRLPELLATEGGGGPGALPSRAPDFSVPRNADIPRRRVEEILGEQTLSRLQTLSNEEIQGIIRSLGENENSVSVKRKKVQEVTDTIQAEIVRRYTSGEADPASALS